MYRLRQSGPAARRLQLLGAGLVGLALLLQALTLFIGARHFAASLSDADSSIEICTPAGLMRISSQSDGSAEPQLLNIKACPYCGAGQFLFLPSPERLPGQLAEFQPPPLPAGLSRPLPAPDQRHAPPRGPPPGA